MGAVSTWMQIININFWEIFTIFIVLIESIFVCTSIGLDWNGSQTIVSSHKTTPPDRMQALQKIFFSRITTFKQLRLRIGRETCEQTSGQPVVCL